MSGTIKIEDSWDGVWFAFDATDFPVGLCTRDKWAPTMKQAAKEFPNAAKIELVTDEERRKALCLQMADGRPG